MVGAAEQGGTNWREERNEEGNNGLNKCVIIIRLTAVEWSKQG